jgi:hypothetical protein
MDDCVLIFGHTVVFKVLLLLEVHPLLSVMLTVYVPELKFCIMDVLAPVFHTYVNGDVPPLAFPTSVPFAKPQLGCVVLIAAVKPQLLGNPLFIVKAAFQRCSTPPLSHAVPDVAFG